MFHRSFADRLPLPPVEGPGAAALAPVLRPGERVPDAIDRRLADLARAAQTGDRAARNTIYLALRPAMAPTLDRLRRTEPWRSREGRSWTWEDVAQETFPIVCRMIAVWPADDPGFAAYFFGRFGWRVRDVLRAWDRAERALPGPGDAASDADLDHAETTLLLEEMLAELDPLDAAIMRRRVLDGATDRETGAALGLAARTVRRRRVRATAALRSALEGGTKTACYAREMPPAGRT
jgi:DNA-directed RNA polymerase specialized sigma24 family protein